GRALHRGGARFLVVTLVGFVNVRLIRACRSGAVVTRRTGREKCGYSGAGGSSLVLFASASAPPRVLCASRSSVHSLVSVKGCSCGAWRGPLAASRVPRTSAWCI